jgi:hypothetical protein
MVVLVSPLGFSKISFDGGELLLKNTSIILFAK